MTPNSDGEPENSKCSSVECLDEVLVVKFSSYEWSTGLLAVGTHSQVLIFSCIFQSDKSSEESSSVQFESVTELAHGCRVTDLAWSPETSMHSAPPTIRLFSAGADRAVRCITSHLKSACIMTVGEHGDYVNGISAEPERGDRVASVSDDLTCCVWSVTGGEAGPQQGGESGSQRGGGQRVACFPLTSPGIAVCWHPKEASKILIAEKKGVMRLYSLVTQQAFMSLDCAPAPGPLVAADWCQANSLRVAALSHSDWLLFDTSRSSRALERGGVHAGGGRLIAWCPSHEHLLATAGQPGTHVRVFNLRSNQVVLSLEFKVCHGLCWHSRLPLLAVGVDKRVQLWHVSTV